MPELHMPNRLADDARASASSPRAFDATALLPPEEVGRRLRAAYAPIAADLARAEAIFLEELGSKFDFVQRLVEHSARFRGKQLRPALVLLTARACGGVRPAHHVLAAVVEMIHTATLVHDDILDEAFVRRHSATINAEWGNEAAVLLGDYLFTHAFHLAASLETTLACRWIGAATNRVCEGELQQVHHRGDLDLAEADYFSIVEGKTAELTAVSCRLGARYADAPDAIVDDMDAFGRHLGIAFQIADDVLDLWGDERSSGKTLGTDLQKQKLTLPLIRLLARSAPAEADRIRHLLAEPTPELRRELRPALVATGALDSAWADAQKHVGLAIDRLGSLPPGPALDLLRDLAGSVLRRAC